MSGRTHEKKVVVRRHGRAVNNLIEMFGSRWPDELLTAVLDITDGDAEVAAERILIIEAGDETKLPNDVVRELRTGEDQKRKEKEKARSMEAKLLMEKKTPSRDSAIETKLLMENIETKLSMEKKTPSHGSAPHESAQSAEVPSLHDTEMRGRSERQTMEHEQNPPVTDLLRISSERHCRGGHCGGEWRRANEMHMLTSANRSLGEDSFSDEETDQVQLTSLQRNATWAHRSDNPTNHCRFCPRQRVYPEYTSSQEACSRTGPCDNRLCPALFSKAPLPYDPDVSAQLNVMSQDEKDRLLYSALLQKQQQVSFQPFPQQEFFGSEDFVPETDLRRSMSVPYGTQISRKQQVAQARQSDIDVALKLSQMEFSRQKTESICSQNLGGNKAVQQSEIDIAIKLSQMELSKQKTESIHNQNLGNNEAEEVQEETDSEMEIAIQLSKTEFARHQSAPAVCSDATDRDFEIALELSKRDGGGKNSNSKEKGDDEDLKRAIEASLSASQVSSSRQRHDFESSVSTSQPLSPCSEKELSMSHKVDGACVTVKGAGTEAVNGTYKRSGTCDGVDMYNKKAVWGNRAVIFCLFRCFLSNDERMWFISIVPENDEPGTDNDIDFYYAPSSGSPNDDFPSQTRWTLASSYATQPGPICLLNGVARLDSARRNDKVHIERAGLDAVNGVYERADQWDGVGLYTKRAFWNGTIVTFTLFRSERCRWFISIVPYGRNPGSNTDTDLYTAEDVGTNLPPQVQWKSIPGFGKEPPPICS
mmetsp:Transcript_23110/g.33946  ORF Transcript_23110/g.33946 Transcript_23110/m.33946 type:complete len:762 (-) Transcript_23110:67-2352(-)